MGLDDFLASAPELRAMAQAEREKNLKAKIEVADARPPEFSDEALALRFSAKHAGDARYVAAWGKWLLWTGSFWAFDGTMRVFDMARSICRVASAEIDNPKQVKLAAAVASAKTVAAVVSLSRADRRHAATIEQWDADAGLNTPGGIIDLRSGSMTPHDPERYLTKSAAIAPDGECPLWLKFLGEITGGDAELQAFLQRVAGYALTDSIREHAASLRGARLVTAQETEQGRRWAESKVKALTGGDPISARFMRQDFFTYLPKFKLLISGNHKPALRGVDEAIRRRFHLIPFTITIPEAKRDLKLPDKLKAEWSGILKWAINGCLEWQRIGLAPPDAVRQATDAYLASEDAIALWLDECCAVDRVYAERSSILFTNWKAWAEAAGEFVGSQKRFSQNLEDRGFIPGRQAGTGQRLVCGLALLPPDKLL